jgi:hypothetical protein
MKYLALGLVSLSLALAGAARAEDPVLTITGQVVVEETDAAGLVTVRIVTETGQSIVIAEYAVLESESPSVGAK